MFQAEGIENVKKPRSSSGQNVEEQPKASVAGAGLAKRKEGEMKSERERSPDYGDPPGHLFLMRRKRCAVPE